MKHGMTHILGCLIPIALIFLLPALGFSSGVTFTVFFILMFACHLFMMGGHPHGGGEPDETDASPETNHRNHSKKGDKSCH